MIKRTFYARYYQLRFLIVFTRFCNLLFFLRVISLLAGTIFLKLVTMLDELYTLYIATLTSVDERTRTIFGSSHNKSKLYNGAYEDVVSTTADENLDRRSTPGLNPLLRVLVLSLDMPPKFPISSFVFGRSDDLDILLALENDLDSGISYEQFAISRFEKVSMAQ